MLEETGSVVIPCLQDGVVDFYRFDTLLFYSSVRENELRALFLAILGKPGRAWNTGIDARLGAGY